MDCSHFNGQMPVQRQKLILSPEQKESLRILQMPLSDLLQEVEKTVEENPVLEYGEGVSDDGILDFFSRSPQKVPGENDEIIWEQETGPFVFGSSVLSEINGCCEENEPPVLIRRECFADELKEQLSGFKLHAQTEKICRYLIENLDERGYLPCSAEELAESAALSAWKVKDALKIVRKLDPAGVGATDLCECLTLQLVRKPDCDPISLKIVKNHLDLVAGNKIRKIAQLLHISPDEAQKCCGEIRKLNPIPSNGYEASEPAVYILPEAEVLPGKDGSVIVRSNSLFQTGLRISPYYRRMADQTGSQDAEKFLKVKIRQASVFLRTVSSRERTIQRILQKIIERQRPCFEKGISYAKPMSIWSLAQELELNESTVSRAIHGKYIRCLFGTVALKSFFTSGIESRGESGTVSSAYVKQQIRSLVSIERKSLPYSDQHICELLHREGIEVSRRTVAKYRDEMQIPSAAKRKTEKEEGGSNHI